MRGLAHPTHWKGPMGDFFQRFGAVKASPMEMYRLLKEGESVLLFPGGAREVRSAHARREEQEEQEEENDFGPKGQTGPSPPPAMPMF